MTILIVDDEIEFVSFLKDRFILKGHAVDIAYDGREGLELIKTNRHDLVFLDHNMPELTGVELVKYMKNNNLKAKTVVITGYQESNEYFMRLAGADEYLSKPVQIKDIDDIIEKYRSIMRKNDKT